MGFNANLPATAKRGVDVNVRAHPGGGLIVLVRIWPDVSGRLGWSRGDAVAVFEGEGEDAGRLMLQPAVRPYASHVRKLGAPGSGEAAGHLQIAVHWPAYSHPFTAQAATYELPAGELEGALIVHMPDAPAPAPAPAPEPPPAAAAPRPPQAAPEPATIASLVPPGKLPAPAPEPEPAAAEAARNDAADSAAEQPAAPAFTGVDIAAIRALAEGKRGNTAAALSAFLASPELGEEELAHILARKGRKAGRGSVASALFQVRSVLRGQGWHIAAPGGGVFRLTPGEDPRARGYKPRAAPDKKPPAPRQPKGKRARPSRAGQDSKPAKDGLAGAPAEPERAPSAVTQLRDVQAAPKAKAPDVRRPPRMPSALIDLAVANAAEAIRSAPPRRERIKAPASGCQYIMVRDGKAEACGAPAKGNYCEGHRAKTAPVAGFPAAGGSQRRVASETGGRRR